MTIETILGFKTPKEISESVYNMLDSAKEIAKTRKGVNEATKSIERGNAKLVVIAEDINPQELIMHIPSLCKEKEIAFMAVPSKQELGACVGLKVATSCVAVEDETLIKDNSKLIADIKKL